MCVLTSGHRCCAKVGLWLDSEAVRRAEQIPGGHRGGSGLPS